MRSVLQHELSRLRKDKLGRGIRKINAEEKSGREMMYTELKMSDDVEDVENEDEDEDAKDEDEHDLIHYEHSTYFTSTTEGEKAYKLFRDLFAINGIEPDF